MTMNPISPYPLRPSQQAMLAAMVFSRQLLLTEKAQPADKPTAKKMPVEFIIDFEDHRNHGIGD
jgi:hypothetical protein